MPNDTTRPTSTPLQPRFRLRLRLGAALLCLGAGACDGEASDPASPLALPCDLADEDCGSHPGAADAVALLEAMNIDPDAATVQLRTAPYQPTIDPANAPAGIDALESVPPDPQAMGPAWSCNNNDVCSCCCRWGGAAWGCTCDC